MSPEDSGIVVAEGCLRVDVSDVEGENAGEVVMPLGWEMYMRSDDGYLQFLRVGTGEICICTMDAFTVKPRTLLTRY